MIGMKKIEAVRGAIRTHMFDRNPVGPEALYLHDADALDWLGAIGVARIIGLVDAHGGNPTGPEVIPILESNLAKVPPRVLSPAGKKRVPERVEQLRTFLQQLRQETRAAAEREAQVIVREAQAEAQRLLDETKKAEGVVQVRMAEAERQFQAYLGGFRALLERQIAELRALDGQRG